MADFLALVRQIGHFAPPVGAPGPALAGLLRRGGGCLRHPAGGPRRARGDRPRDLRQVVGDDAPADPAAQPRRPVLPTPVQPIVALQDVDPPLDARPEAEPAPEPALALVLLPLPRAPPGLGQDDALDPGLARQRFILR